MSRVSLDDYDLGEPLGSGTVGTIYRATEKATGRLVAVKRLHPSFSSNQMIAARFRREMLILERLRHPNIVEYYGGGEEKDGHLFYVMELVLGGSIQDLLKNGPLSWKIVVNCLRQICSALQCAHNHGIIHRDLKPSNLFLTLDGVVKLGDFGIARDINASNLTETGLTVGTHAYMAPEQITGEHNISGQADLYALGCCTYEMLTGRKPFEADTFPQLFEKHLKSPPPVPSELIEGCPPELDAIVVELLAKKPEDRPFNARNVQGRAYAIAEKYGLSINRIEPPPTKEKPDISASSVQDLGQDMLRRQIQARMGTNVKPPVTKLKFFLLVVIGLGLILLGILLNRS